MRGHINASEVSDSGKPMLTRLLEVSYGTEGLMLDIIFETMVCPSIWHPHPEFD